MKGKNMPVHMHKSYLTAAIAVLIIYVMGEVYVFKKEWYEVFDLYFFCVQDWMPVLVI